MTVSQKAKNSKPVRLTDRKRQSILDAALEEFRDNGFVKTNMDGIAARAKVSKRTVYNHFESKQVLFRTIVSDLYNRIMKTTMVPYHREQSVRSQLKEIANQQIDLLTSIEFIELARITFSEYIRSPELAEEVFSNIRSEYPFFLKWIEDAIADGAICADNPAVPAKQFIALIKSFFLWPRLFGGVVPEGSERERVVESTVDMFFSYYARDCQIIESKKR